MEREKAIIKKGQKLEKAYTFFMVPFYYEEELEFKKNELWEKDTDKVSNEGEDGDVLYSYIMNFLQGQMNECCTSEEHLDIYKMSIDIESSWYKDFWEPFVSHANAAYIPVGKDESGNDLFESIAFNLMSTNEQGFKAPHLFLYKTAKVGILTFCIELAESKKNMGYLKLLNYHFHKIHQPTCRCVCSKLSINEKRRYTNDEERIAIEAKFKEIRKYIAPYDEPDSISTCNDFTWDSKGFVDMLLKDINYHLFSKIRMHVFTYCQINDSEQDKLTKDDLVPDLIRLSRCVNDKYMLPFDDLVKTGATLQCFENIYYASAVEGTAILAVAKKSNFGFISQMDGNVRLRYLWIYMLALIQRYSLINMNRQLMHVVSVNDEPKLWDLIKIIKEVKTHCYYTDVSPYTQHSQFYQLCCNNLHIKEAFNEIEEKTKAQNLAISHDMQMLLEGQKEKASIRERRAESGQRRLNLVVGVLTIFQVAGVIYEFTRNTEWQWCAVIITFVFSFILLYFVMNWEERDKITIKWIRKIFVGLKSN